jgi:hypothetical protein
LSWEAAETVSAAPGGAGIFSGIRGSLAALAGRGKTGSRQNSLDIYLTQEQDEHLKRIVLKLFWTISRCGYTGDL